MKKLFVPFTLFILAGVLFSSCSNTSKLSITKRHYRSGYYVNWGSKKQAPVIAKISERTRHKITPIVTAKPENSVASNPGMIASVKSIIARKIEPLKKMQISENKITHSSSTDKNILTANSYAPNYFAETLGVGKQAIYESNDGGGGSSERAALSLLWIVIVVILILWLIGILAGGWGLGGLINLLLVIALILLILWLLRIW